MENAGLLLNAVFSTVEMFKREFYTKIGDLHMNIQDHHIPVLASELLALLQLEPNHTVVDLTLGRSGHAQLVVNKLSPQAHFIGIDADPMQIAYAQEQFKSSLVPVSLLQGNFASITELLHSINILKVDRIYADLGLSTVQLLDPTRGFSFQSDTALDMRLDPNSSAPSAATIIATMKEEELADIFFQLGEEPESRYIAQAIVSQRKIKSITTGIQLAEIVKAAKHRQNKKIHPATQVFQALRMYVNDELGTLQKMLDQIPDLLTPQGRLAVITFHSLEDRLVKNTFKAWHQSGAMTLVNKKVVRPQWTEKRDNPRARSSYLRIIENTSAPIRHSQS